MGVQLVGRKKTIEAVEKTGLSLIRVLRHSNRLWFGFVADGKGGHWHVRIDPVTWEWSTDTTEAFSSCDEYGPHVDPPPGLAIAGSLPARCQLAEAFALYYKNILGFYADERNYDGRAFDGVVGITKPIEDDRGQLARAALDKEGLSE